MAEIILSQVGATVGASLLPNGIGLFGATVSGAVLGQTLGGLAGRAIDAALVPPLEGPRIQSLYVMESREGAGLPLVYGRLRVGGQVIWASRFREYRNEQSSGKGGPSYTEYTYSVSFAVALCQGPITRVDRIWANGELITLSEVNWRLYKGDETQLPDPLIEAIEGSGLAPAYRGTAYIVFEDLPLDTFGNRLPQLSFEIVRAGQSETDSLSATVEGVNIIPASGEFVYATSIVRERQYPGIEKPINMNNSSGVADFALSLEQLQTDLPRARQAALTVAWFGDDVRAGSCRIRPGVERRDRRTLPLHWTVDGIERDDAYLISQIDGKPNYGGTPADQCVIEGIQALRAAGISVTLSPFLMMDVPAGNGLPDPYGRSEQAPFPWRGRITVDADKTDSARVEIDAFVGADGGFGFRHFILHHARLAVQAGGVDAFLIGSEMARLTRIRDAAGRFPFVDALVQIAAEVKAILGPNVPVSYAADWTEYGAYAPGDGSHDVLFPLDPLWASPHVDFVGVDWYPPASDWRDGDDHLDFGLAAGSIEDRDYLLANMAGGEAYDWYYASAADRGAQVRTPIRDTAHGEDWVFRQKDLAGWWSNPHHERVGGVRASQPTAWQVGSKLVRLIEIGFPAIDKGTNSPNLFFDPKSSESAVPPYSSGARDDLLQKRALAVANQYWLSQPMVEQVLVWAWDARPWPDYPTRDDLWSDGENWQFGHWLNGRSGLITISEVIEDVAQRGGITLDASRISGVLEGFSIGGVMTLASAISPLATAFEFSLRETETGISALHEGITVEANLPRLELVEASLQKTQILLDKQANAVSLNYISGDEAYGPAVIEARDPAADTGFAISVSVPIVMSEARAQALAARLLEQGQALDFCALSIPPGLAPGLEVMDRVSLDGNDWIVERIEEQAIQRHLKLRRPKLAYTRNQTLEAPGRFAPAILPAEPFAKIVDGPPLQHLEVDPPFIAASAEPWRGVWSVKFGSDSETLIELASIGTPAGIGRIGAPLAEGPHGRWDQANHVELYMPGERLESVSEAAVFAGQNRILVEHADGWELLAWKTAELIGDDYWRLSDLLRGLEGSPIRTVETDACAILADARLVPLRFSVDKIGVEQFWRVGTGDVQTFTYQDRASRPWRVGHLHATNTETGWDVTWTPRGPNIPDNWALNDQGHTLSFQIETYLGIDLVSSVVQSATQVSIPIGAADSIRVAAVASDGRVGEWGSIPLTRA